MNADAHGKFSGKRLVIFGCGYVGTAVAWQALAQGWRVQALTRNAANAETLRASGIEVVVADLASPEWHGHLAPGPDAILNCVSGGGGGVEGYRRSYVEGLASIRTWAGAQREAGGATAGTMIYTSSTSVYPQDGGVHVDELAPAEPSGERPQLLREAENLVSAPPAPWQRWFVLRLAGIYGPGRHHVIDQVRTGEVSGRGEVHLNVIHRDDIVAAVMALAGAPANVESGIFNLADDGAATKAEVVAWLTQRLGVPAPRFTGEPLARRTATPDRVIVNTRLKTVLGWRPAYPTFREGYENLLSR